MKKYIYQILILTGLLMLQSCATIWHTSDVDIRNLSINKYRAEPDQKVVELVAPYKAQLDAEMNVVLIENAEIMYKQKPNSALGNWMADAVAEAARDLSTEDIQFGILNHGGIRVPNLPAGDITVGKIYELMPFDNTVVILHTKGEIVQQLAERIIDYGGWPISQEIRIVSSEDKAVQVFINNEPLNMQADYHFAIADYVANGGDSCYFLKDQKREKPGVLLRDIFIHDLKKKAANNEKLVPNKQIRIK